MVAKHPVGGVKGRRERGAAKRASRPGPPLGHAAPAHGLPAAQLHPRRVRVQKVRGGSAASVITRTRGVCVGRADGARSVFGKEVDRLARREARCRSPRRCLVVQ